MEMPHDSQIDHTTISSIQLSPIVCADDNTHAMKAKTPLRSPINRMKTIELGDDDDNKKCGSAKEIYDEATMTMDTSFPDDRGEIEIKSPDITSRRDESTENHNSVDEERLQREIEESEALARQLMAEEAMASYAMSAEYLRDNAEQFSTEDFAALQAAMAEEDPEIDFAGSEDNDDDSSSRELSYDALLRLGERIGDVKEERWALIARGKINKLKTLDWVPSMAKGKEENHTAVKCQVCQFRYNEGDKLRELPCLHYFHEDCIDLWLETKDTCALCRKSIVAENDQENDNH